MITPKNISATSSGPRFKSAVKFIKAKKSGQTWRKAVEREEEKEKPLNPAIKASPFPPPRAIFYPEWRRQPNILKRYCRPVVIDAVKSMGSKMSNNSHFINILKNDPRWNSVQLSCFNDSPSSAENYAHNLDFIFQDKEAARIAVDLPKIEARLTRNRRPGKNQFTDSYFFTYWDMFQEDLDGVCERATREYFARENDMFVVQRCAHRMRRFGLQDAYRYREVKDWKPQDAKWWLNTLYPKAGGFIDRAFSDAGF